MYTLETDFPLLTTFALVDYFGTAVADSDIVENAT